VWSYKKLSLIGRILVANQMILASIWYLASCTNISLSSGKGENFYMQLCVVWEGRSQGVGEGCLGHNNIAFD
jgi:hypothetical protein